MTSAQPPLEHGFAAVDAQEALGVEVAAVARVPPAAGERALARRRVAPVAAHHVAPAHVEFSDLFL